MKISFSKARARERGYVLLALLLVVALLSIGLFVSIQNTAFQIKRDREEELIHRGVQYSRAVRLFFKRYRRYPGSIEELENTNNIRFLRKRYKDPITGKDFKPLHINEVALFNPNPVTGPVPAGVQTQETNASTNNEEGASEVACTPVSDDVDPAVFDTPPCPKSNSASPNLKGGNPAGSSEADPNDPDANPAPELHGVPIVGVSSLSRARTIREFGEKNHYNQWLFIFSPHDDAGWLINTPDQPPFKRSALAVGSQNGENQGQSNGSVASGALAADQ